LFAEGRGRGAEGEPWGWRNRAHGRLGFDANGIAYLGGAGLALEIADIAAFPPVR
jgi:hypothetical protein